jgi:allantoin racemase
MAHAQIVNPNTSAATTALILRTAVAAAPIGLTLTALTAQRGPSLIVDPEGLAVAAAAVAELAPEFTSAGVIVAAFGDPGADVLRSQLKVPVIGIGEAAIRAAQSGGRRYSIVTTTPKLVAGIQARVEQLGCGADLASIRVSTEDPARLTADAVALEARLQDLVDLCVAQDGAEAVIIGGGPLAAATAAIAGRTRVAIIAPVPAAVAWLAKALGLTARPA